MQDQVLNHLTIDRVTTADAIFDRLRVRIVRGALTPGTRLSENEVAQDLGVSRTPVREAFIQLRQQGLLRILPQRGSFVAPINIADVENSFFLRETLELRTAELAAGHCDAAAATRLTDILQHHRGLIADGSREAFMAADDAMHRELVEICGRPLVWQVVSDAKLQIDRLRYLIAQDTASRQRIVADHQRIVDAVVSNDPTAAVQAMRHHLGSIFPNIERLRTEHPAYIEHADADQLEDA